MKIGVIFMNKNFNHATQDLFDAIEDGDYPEWELFVQMMEVDAHENPHINYEPSLLGGLKEAKQTGKEYTPYIEGNLVRAPLDRTNDTKQAGESYRKFEKWEQDDLILNLTTDLAKCAPAIQETMIRYAEQADADYGRRLRENLQHAQSTGPLGNADSDEAVEQAMNESQETDRL